MARIVDEKLREAYIGHHRYFVIDNEGVDFHSKINKTLDVVRNIVGLPSDAMNFKKFLVEPLSQSQLD